MIAKSRYTWFLLILYLSVFHLWRLMDRHWVVVSGTSVFVLLCGAIALLLKRRYFVNRWDATFHAAVVFDILIEAILIEDHSNFHFYGCAAGFAIVLVGYRMASSRRIGLEARFDD